MKTLLKLVFAIAIMAWLFGQGKLDFTKLWATFSDPKIVATVVFMLGIQILIGAYRWKKLLELKSNVPLDFFTLTKIQWIGQFFSSALPGAVTGDLIKLTYIKKIDETMTNRYLLFSVLFDRIIGLSALLFIAGIGSLVYYNDLIHLTPKMHQVIKVNMIFLILSLGFIAIFFIPRKLSTKIITVVKIKKIQDLLHQIWAIADKRNEVIKAFLVSLFAHGLSISAFYLINMNFFEGDIGIKDLATIIPLGQVAVALPISPAGLGVGHVAYENLFRFLGQNNGATLFNNFWFYAMFVNILGVIPYLMLTNKKKD